MLGIWTVCGSSTCGHHQSAVISSTLAFIKKDRFEGTPTSCLPCTVGHCISPWITLALSLITVSCSHMTWSSSAIAPREQDREDRRCQTALIEPADWWAAMRHMWTCDRALPMKTLIKQQSRAQGKDLPKNHGGSPSGDAASIPAEQSSFLSKGLKGSVDGWEAHSKSKAAKATGRGQVRSNKSYRRISVSENHQNMKNRRFIEKPGFLRKGKNLDP